MGKVDDGVDRAGRWREVPFPVVQVDLAPTAIFTEKDVESAIPIEVAHRHTVGVVPAERAGRWRKISPPVVQVDLAILPVVAKDEVEAPVAVEVAQCYAQGTVAARVDRGSRGGVPSVSVVQVDLARQSSRTSQDEVEAPVTIEVAQRHARGRERLCLIQIERELECGGRQARDNSAALAVVEVDLARFKTVAEKNINGTISVEVTQRHAFGGDSARVERGSCCGEAPLAIVQVDLAWLVIVTEENIQGAVAVEVSQCYAPGGVAGRIECEGRGGEATRPVQIDLTRLPIIAKDDVELAIAVEVAHRHAPGIVAGGVEREGRGGESARPVVHIDLA